MKVHIKFMVASISFQLEAECVFGFGKIILFYFPFNLRVNFDLIWALSLI